jgi:hypothetical protein
MRHFQRQINVAFAIFIEALARNPLHECGQNNKIKVAVEKSGTRRFLGRVGKCHPIRCFLPFPRHLQVKIWLESGVVGQQLPHCNVFLSILRELRQVFGNRIIQPHLALFD